jgi:phosphoserine phosphatase
MILAQRYGIELPGRPDSWHRKQARQKPVRDELDRMRVEVLRRRLFRILEPMVRDVEDEALREEVAREVWTALWPQAEHMLREHRKEGAS